MELSQIYIYPIKSLGGISLTQSQVQARGLAFDRRWMLVDEQGNFLTQRTFAEMALLKVALEPDALVVRHQGRPELNPLRAPLVPASGRRDKVVVWDDTCEALEVSPAANAWFSEALGKPCRLVFMPDDSLRQVDQKYARPGDITSFTDGFPILIVGEASLADLNQRLEQPVPMDRFRPSLVFRGGLPFEEDNWNHFSIGNLTFQGVKPCGRCVVTTIDQQTAQKNPEPLRTLSTFRQVGHKTLFGQNVLPLSPGGEIKLGDTLTVQSYWP